MLTHIVIAATALIVSGLTLFSGFGLGTILMPAFALSSPYPSPFPRRPSSISSTTFSSSFSSDVGPTGASSGDSRSQLPSPPSVARGSSASSPTCRCWCATTFSEGFAKSSP
jgi:hypothetical protein